MLAARNKRNPGGKNLGEKAKKRTLSKTIKRLAT
jgi:hypothetical protein